MALDGVNFKKCCLLQALVTSCLGSTDLGPQAVRYVAVHGTGTPLGDPIEIGALGGALSYKQRRSIITLGSNKVFNLAKTSSQKQLYCFFGTPESSSARPFCCFAVASYTVVFNDTHEKKPSQHWYVGRDFAAPPLCDNYSVKETVFLSGSPGL